MKSKKVLAALKSRISWNPFIFSHLITSQCNCHCQMCVYKDSSIKENSNLSLKEIKEVYKSALGLGFTDFVLWGGEPLIRDDILDIVSFLYDSGHPPILITNGFLLHDKIQVIPFLDRIILSIDSPDEYHDVIRGRKGLFNSLIKGLDAIKGKIPTILIAVVTQLNNDRIDDLIIFAEKYGASILFQAPNSDDYGYSKTNSKIQSLLLSIDEEKGIFASLLNHKQKGAPILNSKTYLKMYSSDHRSYSCYYKHTLVRMEPDGKILDCTGNQKVLGDIRKDSLGDILSTSTYRDFLERSHSCNRCADVGVVETSRMWQGNLDCLVNMIKSV
jgi:MoaA/NifB/PqqE/SkfB family radical SAM enzyme